MNWRQWTWKSVAKALFVALLIVGAVVYSVWSPLSRVNSGFGPEWDCSNPRPGLPVCTKKPREQP